MLRHRVDESSVTTLVETLHVAIQRVDKDELSFAERLRRLNTECGFVFGEGAIKGRFVEGVHRAARATVRKRNTPGMTMAERARVAQTKGDEHVVVSARKADGARPRQKTQHRMRSDTKEKEHKRLDHRAQSAPERRN